MTTPSATRRRSPSLRTRVTAAAALVTVLIVLAVGAIAWVQVRDSAFRELDARVDTLSAAFQPSLSASNTSTITTGVSDGALATARIGGIVLQSTGTQIPARGTGVGDTTIDGTRYRVKTVSAVNSGLLNGLVVSSVAVPVQSTVDRVASQRRALLYIGLAAVAASALLAWLLGGLAIRPLRRLARHTEVIPVDAGPEAPERAALVDIRGAREAEDLASAMESLLRRVDVERGRTHEALVTARDFASVSAHELRTPLTAMRTDLEVLDTFTPDPEARAEIVRDLRRAHARIQETLAALESLAQGDLGGRDRVEVDLADLLDRVVTEARSHHRGVEVELVSPPSVPVVAIETGLRMAVGNAITNAVRHGEARRVRVSVDAAGDGVAIIVDDDGRGVPPADRDRLFRRFERGTTRQSGSGLGLALIAQQAALHGGSATLSESPWGGARLTVTIAPTPAHRYG
ncbi:ATP-binding protein [Williamsia deligens]|uniref:histidine kinase n=1 Tax=Williamsia deligens TaxID=321325 RepID=A0ABW3GCB5_9NOCA|nr:HAMP domain-containing sensor histidine kinase [Williamsia deligens]MCP2192794.1 two-component system, OmpR family, sensor histidine kinase PrrB [Williamsia deligens]